jgi:transposase
MHAAEQDRPDIKEKRDGWFDQVADVKVNDLIFLDEFGAATNMARTHARGPKGQRVVCKTPHGHWKTISTIAAMTVWGILTAVSYDAAVNTEAFVGFVEQFLLPLLRPGQVLILDNLPAHKSAEVDRLVESAGAKVLRLPPYSPDYNPIEMAISKAKSSLRTLAARTVHDLFDAIGQSLLAINRDDAAHYIRHCGYGATNG